MPGCASDWPAAADCSQETLSRYQDTGDWSLGAWECLRRDEEPGARRRHGGNGELGQGLNFYLSPRIISDKYEARQWALHHTSVTR